MSSVLSPASIVFEGVIGMIPTVSTTIMGNPLLLLMVIIPVIGLGVGLFRRLLNVN